MQVVTIERPLDYAPPGSRRERRGMTSLRLAFTCGSVPALIGTLIVALWLLTHYGALTLLGLFNILLGLACTVVGGVALLVHFRPSNRNQFASTRQWLLGGAFAGAILLANFPLCAFYVWVANLYTVRVVNATGAQVTSFVVSDPAGHAWEFGPIPAGRQKTRMLDVEGEGALSFSATVNGKVETGIVDGYITNGVTGDGRTVTLNAGGSHSVR
jgi:hypothetical protein